MDELCELELKILKELQDVSILQNNLICNSRYDDSIISYSGYEEENHKKNNRSEKISRDMENFETFRMKENIQQPQNRRRMRRRSNFNSGISGNSLILIEREKSNRKNRKSFGKKGGREVEHDGFKPSFRLLKAKKWDKKFSENRSKEEINKSQMNYARKRKGSIGRKRSSHSKIIKPAKQQKIEEEEYLELYDEYIRDKSTKKLRNDRSFHGSSKFITPEKPKKKILNKSKSKSRRKIGPPKLRTPSRSGRKQSMAENYSFQPSLSKKSLKIAKKKGNSFTRLTKKRKIEGLTSEELELKNCTFSPIINRKRRRSSKAKKAGMRRVEELIQYVGIKLKTTQGKSKQDEAEEAKKGLRDQKRNHNKEYMHIQAREAEQVPANFSFVRDICFLT